MVKRKDALRALLSGGEPPTAERPGERTTEDASPAPSHEAEAGASDRSAADAGRSGDTGAAPGASVPPTQAPRPSDEHVRSGAINAMRASWGAMQREAEEARRLREAAMSGGHVIEVDPANILPSPVADRLAAGPLDPDFAALKASIAEGGQSVPVLLRPHADPAKAAAGLFQTAYGHRRIRAARELGLTVRAIVRPLTDEELVLAQGRENAERRDLTFVERAFFAQGLETRGFSRATIGAALGIDKSELTRLLQVARRVPEGIAQRIGPAPKAGRPRWLALADALEARGGEDRAWEFVQRETFTALADSDARFRALLTRMQTGQTRAKSDRTDEPVTIRDASGAAIATKTGGTRPALAFPGPGGAAFAAFVAEALPEIHARFRRTAEAVPDASGTTEGDATAQTNAGAEAEARDLAPKARE